jgi:hypothetical protein
VCLCEAFKNLNARKKGIFYNYGKTRVVFAKCIWMGGNFKIGEGLFCKHIFLTLTPVKKCIYPKVSFEMYVLNCVNLSEVCENKGLCVIIQKYESFYASV